VHQDKLKKEITLCSPVRAGGNVNRLVIAPRSSSAIRSGPVVRSKQVHISCARRLLILVLRVISCSWTRFNWGHMKKIHSILTSRVTMQSYKPAPARAKTLEAKRRKRKLDCSCSNYIGHSCLPIWYCFNWNNIGNDLFAFCSVGFIFMRTDFLWKLETTRLSSPGAVTLKLKCSSSPLHFNRHQQGNTSIYFPNNNVSVYVPVMLSAFSAEKLKKAYLWECSNCSHWSKLVHALSCASLASARYSPYSVS